jgi:hypothetical protein
MLITKKHITHANAMIPGREGGRQWAREGLTMVMIVSEEEGQWGQEGRSGERGWGWQGDDG